MPTFTSGNDTYTVSSAGTYDLDMLAGDDRLNVYGGTNVTAHLGLGNDLAIVKAALVSIFGDAGTDRFDVYASNAVIDGGADNDTVNIRGGSGLSAHGGLGDDRFNFYADASSVTLNGDDGNDDFYGYNHNVAGALYGGAGDDYFIQFRTGATLRGGLGDDIYRITVGSPATIVENAGEGSDSVQVARGYDYTLPDNVENMSTQGFSGSVLVGATLTGNSLNNHIAAHNNGDTLNGLDGNDSLNGKGGDDTIDGGNGDDYLDGATGNDILIGGIGDDVLQGRAGNDAMSGGGGDDLYYVDSDGDVIEENVDEGIDTLRLSLSFTLGANVENAIVQSGVGGVVITGNALDNQLTGNSGDDSLIGGGGNDTLKGGLGNDWMAGGTGDDIYVVDSATDVVVENASEGTDTVRVALNNYALPSNVENAEINVSGDATLTGNALNNILTGGAGSDMISGGDGNDVVEGGAGNDTVDGGAGRDLLEGGDGDDVLTGGISIDDLRGGSGNDTLYGGGSADSLQGFDGNDTLTGGDEADDLIGGLGDDTYILTGDDFTQDAIYEFAGGGYDMLQVTIVSGGYTMPDNVEDATGSVLNATAEFMGNALDNNIFVDGGWLNGWYGNDVLSGGITMFGMSGDDLILGGTLNAELLGGDGNDDLRGGSGNETFNGERGTDVISGGGGSDYFMIDGDCVPSAVDTIKDFHSTFGKGLVDDKLDLHYIDANRSTILEDPFNYIGSANFSGTAGELRATVFVSGKGITVYHFYGDTNGDAVADIEFIVDVVGTTLYADDMIL